MIDLDDYNVFVPPPPEGKEGMRLYREWGFYLKHREMFPKAIECFNIAHSIDPNDRRTLLGRSQVYSAATNFEGSLADAEAALALDPNDLPAANQRAQATYELGCFERALALYYRGWHKRKQPPYFEAGVHQCAETVEDCIGYNVGSVLKDFAPVIKKMVAYNLEQEEIERNRPEETCVEDTPEEIAEKEAAKIIPSEKLKADILGRVMAEKYLGRLAHDKNYLEMLKDDPRLESCNEAGYKKLKQITADAYQTLQDRQEVLRTRRPFYSVKYRELGQSQRLLMAKKDALQRQRNMLQNTGDSYLAKMRQARQNRDIKTTTAIVQRAKLFFDSKPYHLMPKKDEYLTALYNIAGLTHFQALRMNEDQSSYEQQKRIHWLYGQPLSREPSDDSVIKAERPTQDNMKTIKECEKNIDGSKNSLEKTYWFYELARTNMEQKKYDVAKDYAKRSLGAAKAIRNYAWVVNAGLICSRCSIYNRDRLDAKRMVQEAIDAATTLHNDVTLDFLNKSLEYIDDIDFDDMAFKGGLAQREKDIVNVMMGSDMKGEAKELFRRMSVMPANRTLSIMPGVEVKKDPALSKNVSRKSIMNP